jgi:hypothetical protein
MNMSETPEKKKARLRYDNVFKTAWTDEFHFIKHSRKGNKFAFCEFCKTATECTILQPSETDTDYDNSDRCEVMTIPNIDLWFR